MKRIGKSRWYAATWGLPPVIWQGMFFVAPLIFLVVLSFWSVENFRLVPDLTLHNWATELSRSSFWQVYFTTALLAMLATVLATIIAFPASYYVSLVLGSHSRRLLILLFIIPFFTSYLVRIYSWQIMLADTGPVNVALSMLGVSSIKFVGTPLGVLVGYLTLALPIVVLLQVSSIANMDRNLIEAASNLGCRPFTAVFRVIVPASRVGIFLGALFCFILAFGDFVSPLYLGSSNPTTLSILITDTTKSGQQWPRAAVIAVTMIVTLLTAAFVMVGLAYRRVGKLK